MVIFYVVCKSSAMYIDVSVIDDQIIFCLYIL